MITKEQATAVVPLGNPEQGYFRSVHDQFHHGDCRRAYGPRGGITVASENWRRNGVTKTWKKSPERFRIPVKYGLYAHGYITEENAGDFHLASECPLRAMNPEEYQKAEAL